MKIIAVILGVFLLTQPFLHAEELDKELVQERAKVEARFLDNANQVVLAVDGLCCRNCGIGIGNKVCKLVFVDSDALPNGVEVHRKDALLTVAVKEGESFDFDSLVKAIREAGYDPVRLYERNGDGALKSTDIPKE